MSDRLVAPAATLFRLAVSLMFALHGAASLFGVLGGSRGSGQPIDVGVWPGWYAAVIQFVAGGLVVVGLATRWSALLCSGSMAYAYFVVHQPDALAPVQNGGESAALFCWGFLLIAILGPGPFSLDALISRRWRGSDEREPAHRIPATAEA